MFFDDLPLTFTCTAEDTDIYGDPGYCDEDLTYSWTNGGGSGATFPFSPSSPGVYSITGTVSSLHEGPFSHNWNPVKIKGLTGISASSSEVCPNTQVTLTANGTFGADGGSSVSWSGDASGTGTPIAKSWSNPGDYNVSATYGNTVGPTTVTVLGITGICGPSVVVSGVNAQFIVHGHFGANPSNTVSWGGGETPTSGSGSSYTTQWSTWGFKTVTATCCGVQWELVVFVTDNTTYPPGPPPPPTPPDQCHFEQ